MRHSLAGRRRGTTHFANARAAASTMSSCVEAGKSHASARNMLANGRFTNRDVAGLCLSGEWFGPEYLAAGGPFRVHWIASQAPYRRLRALRARNACFALQPDPHASLAVCGSVGGMGIMIFDWESNWVQPRAAGPLHERRGVCTGESVYRADGELPADSDKAWRLRDQVP
jgi:hypothetical protein